MDGYNASAPQEMSDTRRLLERRRAQLAGAMSEDMVGNFDADPIGTLSKLSDPDLRQMALDYVNAKAVYDGMIQWVRDDIDERIALSDAMVDRRVHKQSGQIQTVTTVDGREVYLVDGEVQMYEDGSPIAGGVDV